MTLMQAAAFIIGWWIIVGVVCLVRYERKRRISVSLVDIHSSGPTAVDAEWTEKFPYDPRT